MSQSEPISHDSLIGLLDFITPEERDELEKTAYDYLDSGVLVPNPAGPNRLFAMLYGSRHCTPLINSLGDRIAERLGLSDFDVDPFLGYVISMIRNGGAVHPHFDKYNSRLEGMRHLRCNVMVSRLNETYDPVISDMIVPVPERSAWAFMASECRHGTQTILGESPRIIFGFGWVVPGDYSLSAYQHRV